MWIECFAWVWMLGLKLKRLKKYVCKSERLVGAQLSQNQPNHSPKTQKFHPCSLTAWRWTQSRQALSVKSAPESNSEPSAWRLISVRLAPHQKNWPRGILLICRLAARDLPPGGSEVRAVVGPFKICSDLAQTLTPYYSRLAPCSHSSPHS